MTTRNKDICLGVSAFLLLGCFIHNCITQENMISELEGRIKKTESIFQEARRDYNAAVDAEGNPFIKDTVIYVSTKDMRKAGFALNP